MKFNIDGLFACNKLPMPFVQVGRLIDIEPQRRRIDNVRSDTSMGSGRLLQANNPSMLNFMIYLLCKTWYSANEPNFARRPVRGAAQP